MLPIEGRSTSILHNTSSFRSFEQKSHRNDDGDDDDDESSSTSSSSGSGRKNGLSVYSGSDDSGGNGGEGGGDAGGGGGGRGGGGDGDTSKSRDSWSVERAGSGGIPGSAESAQAPRDDIGASGEGPPNSEGRISPIQDGESEAGFAKSLTSVNAATGDPSMSQGGRHGTGRDTAFVREGGRKDGGGGGDLSATPTTPTSPSGKDVNLIQISRDASAAATSALRSGRGQSGGAAAVGAVAGEEPQLSRKPSRRLSLKMMAQAVRRRSKSLLVTVPSGKSYRGSQRSTKVGENVPK